MRTKVTLTSYALKLIRLAETASSKTSSQEPVEPKGRTALGKCPCGNLAYVKFLGAPGCDRCIAIEKKFMYETGKAGVKRTAKVDYYETGHVAD
jgi:hypothetical protein